MSLLKVWLTAPTVQLTSSSFSLSLLSWPEASLKQRHFICIHCAWGSSLLSSMCTSAGRPGCGGRWSFGTPLSSNPLCSSRRSCSERTACHPAAPGSLQTGGSEPECSLAPAPGPVDEKAEIKTWFWITVHADSRDHRVPELVHWKCLFGTMKRILVSKLLMIHLLLISNTMTAEVLRLQLTVKIHDKTKRHLKFQRIMHPSALILQPLA